jgi:hypothetical protein
MGKRKEDFPLEKVTINLFEGDVARFNQLFPRLRVSKFLRETLRRTLRKIENEAQRAPQPVVEDIDLEGIEFEVGEEA